MTRVLGRFSAPTTAQHTAHAMGNAGVHVVATPWMVWFCVRAAMQPFAGRFRPRCIALDHVAAAPAGADIRAEAVPIGIEDAGPVFRTRAVGAGRELMTGTVTLDAASDRTGRCARTAPAGPGPGRGPRGRYRTMVDAAHLGAANGFSAAPELTDPWLSLFCEEAGDRALRPGFGRGEASVGVRLELDHLAPVPAGRLVTIEAALERREGRRARFAVNGISGGRPFVRGSHERVVVDLERFLAGLAKRRDPPASPQRKADPAQRSASARAVVRSP